MKRAQKGQVSIEVSLAFVAILLFLLGMLRVWFWINNDLYQRQQDYISTRSGSGSWPIHQSELSDDVIFRGRF